MLEVVLVLVEFGQLAEACFDSWCDESQASLSRVFAEEPRWLFEANA